MTSLNTAGLASASEQTEVTMLAASTPLNETCPRYGRALATDWRSRLTHVSAQDGATDVGCRAASFTPNKGWDLAIPRAWKATRSRRATAKLPPNHEPEWSWSQ